MSDGKTWFNFDYGQWNINIATRLDWQASIRQIAHQIGHVLGLAHIPEWYATAIMNPMPAAECLTWADYGIWPEQNPNYYKLYK